MLRNHFQKTGWKSFLFDDIASSISDRVDDPRLSGVDRYVGLEHLDSQSIKIRRWGEPEDVSATKLRFYPGDVIYGRRRAYQRKLGVADFEGICSAHALVLRAKEDVCLAKFLPYFLQTDLFHQKAVDISVGSLSPTINWKTLARQTFFLPSLKDQEKIIEIISSIDKTIEAYQDLPLKSQRESMLHGLLTAGGNGWTETTLGDIADLISRGRAPSYCEEDGVVVLNQKCIRNGRIFFEFARRTDTIKKTIPDWAYLRTGDTLINSTGVGTLGRASFVTHLNSPTTFDSHLTLVRPRPDSSLASFIGLSLNFRENEIETFAGGSTGQTELSRAAVNSFPISLPPLDEQRRIVEIVSSMDDVIWATKQAILDLKVLRRTLLTEILSVNDNG